MGPRPFPVGQSDVNLPRPPQRTGEDSQKSRPFECDHSAMSFELLKPLRTEGVRGFSRRLSHRVRRGSWYIHPSARRSNPHPHIACTGLTGIFENNPGRVHSLRLGPSRLDGTGLNGGRRGVHHLSTETPGEAQRGDVDLTAWAKPRVVHLAPLPMCWQQGTSVLDLGAPREAVGRRGWWCREGMGGGCTGEIKNRKRHVGSPSAREGIPRCAPYLHQGGFHPFRSRIPKGDCLHPQ